MGAIVRFARPAAEEAADRFVVLELRGPRVLVAAHGGHWSIVPTFVYLADELVEVGEVAPGEAA